MAANKFGRYVWLVDLIRCHPYITFKEISDKWEDCGLGDGKLTNIHNYIADYQCKI